MILAKTVDELCQDNACSADHLVPRHDGGMTEPGNIVAACRKCNSERHPEWNKSAKSDGYLFATAGDDAPRSAFDELEKLRDK